MTIKKQGYALTLLPPPPVPGERVFVTDGTSGTIVQSWVVPANVYSISAVCVSMYSAGVHKVARIMRGGTELLSAAWSIGTNGCAGGNGGASTGYGNGGAGGYSGNGGNGAGYLGDGSPGTGGGGGGGCMSPYPFGGGVGLLGQGANGAGGVYNTANGGNGSPSPIMAGASDYGTPSDPGGNLRYLNNIAVTPGETLTIDLGYALQAGSSGRGTAIRVMWGNDGRSYPSNAGDAIPKGQAVITSSNTTFVIPTGVTSICACAQQQDGNSAAVSLVVSGATVLRAQNGARIGDGGGDGGSTPGVGYGGGGGGGYAGNGGNGGLSDAIGTAGAGGGGGGGNGPQSYWVVEPVFGGSSGPGGHWEYTSPMPGGGVGIQGQGVDGAAGGNVGSPDPINGHAGGGSPGVQGGALAYKNSIAVTPGQVLTVNAAGGRVRIIWGPGRSYPSAAGNV